jgi:hypothetical protein
MKEEAEHIINLYSLKKVEENNIIKFYKNENIVLLLT